MARKSYSEHRIRALGSNQILCLSRELEAGRFLVPWTFMDPQVSDCSWPGPTWPYERRGRPAEAKVPVTVRLRNGDIEYWDVVDDRSGVPASIAVKRANSSEEGKRYRLFDTNFIESNVVEVRNRTNAYFLLLNAEGFDLGPVETDLMLALGAQPILIRELDASLSHEPLHIRAALFRLWKTGRVSLPMQTGPIGADSLATRTGHGAP